MKTLKEQIMGRCRHYAAPFNHEKCDAGVPYAGMREKSGPALSWPCFRPAECDCPEASFLTEAEADAEVKRLNDSMARIGTARAAIIAVTGEWFRGKPDLGGAIKCPCCGVEGALHYRMSGYNGHVHARCDTGCVAWME